MVLIVLYMGHVIRMLTIYQIFLSIESYQYKLHGPTSPLWTYILYESWFYEEYKTIYQQKLIG